MLVLALQSAWTIGTMAVALVAWAVLPNAGWRVLLALSAIPAFALLIGYAWLPESPMWLFVKDKYAEAEKVVSRLAAAKNIENPIKLRLTHERYQGDQEEEVHLEKKGRIRAFFDYSKNSFKQVWSKDMALTTSLLLFIWFVNSLVYYGLVLLTTALHSGTTDDGEQCTEDGRPAFSNWDYLSVVITSLAEAPGILVAALLIDSKGRLLSIRVGLFICSGCLVGLIFTGTNARVIRLVLLFGARAAIECTFSTLYVFTPELFATPIRSFGLALCNSFSRIGGFVAPFATVFLVEDGRPQVAAIVLGVLCGVASISSILLPKETQGMDLDSIDTTEVSCDGSNVPEEELQEVSHDQTDTEMGERSDKPQNEVYDEHQPLVKQEQNSSYA